MAVCDTSLSSSSSAPPVVPASEVILQSTRAVADLHRSMVTLRSELVRKNERIRALEARVEVKETNGIGGPSPRDPSFEDMFVLQVGKEDVDQILLYEESLAKEAAAAAAAEEDAARKEEEERVRAADNSSPTEDLVEAFVAMSEDEEEEKEKEEAVAVLQKNSVGCKSPEQEDCAPIKLVMNQDIVLHNPPPVTAAEKATISTVASEKAPADSRTLLTPDSSSLAASQDRPVLREPSPLQQKASSSSQTDITALKTSAAAKPWSSEPELVYQRSYSSSSSTVAASSSTKVKPQAPIASPSSSSVIASSGAKREVEKRLAAGKARALRDKGKPHAPLPSKPAQDMSDPSTDIDDILEEAEDFLRVARQKLVTSRDWEGIRRTKKRKK